MKCKICVDENKISWLTIPGDRYVENISAFNYDGEYVPQREFVYVRCSHYHTLKISTSDGGYLSHEWIGNTGPHQPTPPLTRQDLADLKKLGAITKLPGKQAHANGKAINQD